MYPLCAECHVFYSGKSINSRSIHSHATSLLANVCLACRGELWGGKLGFHLQSKSASQDLKSVRRLTCTFSNDSKLFSCSSSVGKQLGITCVVGIVTERFFVYKCLIMKTSKCSI